MARPSDFNSPEHELPGFDVTCVVGRVTYDELGPYETAAEAAMILIAKHDAEGRYEFPIAGDVIQTVTIERSKSR